MKKYKVIIGSDKFECKDYIMEHTYIVFTGCDNEDYTKIIPTNVVISIYPIKK